MLKNKTDAKRRAQLGWIHQAKSALQMQEDDYRAMLVRVTGAMSAADLNAHQRQAVLTEMRRLGWQPPANARRRDNEPAASKEKLWGKIDAQLHALGKSRAYLDGNIRLRLAGGVERWEWATEEALLKIVAALQIQLRRDGKT